MEVASRLEKTVEHLKDYADTKLDLFILNASDKVSSSLSTIASIIFIGVLAIITILLASIGVALWIGSTTGNTSMGFFYVAGFYVIVSVVIYALRGRLIKTPIINMLLKGFHIDDEN